MADRERLIIASVVLLVHSMLAGCAYKRPDIHQAILSHRLDRVKSILEEDPKQIKAKGYRGGSPLHYAIGPFSVDIFKFLIASGADLNARDKKGSTPLHRAIEWGHEQNVELLLVNGADANVRNKKGKTPLDIALLYNRRELVKLLRKHGTVSSVNDKDKNG